MTILNQSGEYTILDHIALCLGPTTIRHIFQLPYVAWGIYRGQFMELATQTIHKIPRLAGYTCTQLEPYALQYGISTNSICIHEVFTLGYSRQTISERVTLVIPAAIIVLSVSLKFASAFYRKETQTACYQPCTQALSRGKRTWPGYEVNMVQSSAKLAPFPGHSQILSHSCFSPRLRIKIWEWPGNKASANPSLHLPPLVGFAQDTCLPFCPK